MKSPAKLRAIFSSRTTDTALHLSPTSQSHTTDGRDGPHTNDKAPVDGLDSTIDVGAELQSNHDDFQAGVRAVEAITSTWSRTSLIAVFINIWLLYFVNAFQSSILSNLIPFITSDFETHSLLNVVYIVADAITAACFIPLAKILDVWGRAEGFLLMTMSATLGLVLMAVCQNLSTFCAAYVFYSVGFTGMTYCVDVITADASQLKNRGLAYAFTSSPYIITAFAGPKASDDFYYGVKNWRWGFGCFAIIFPVVAAPLFFVLRINLRRAKASGSVESPSNAKTLPQTIWKYYKEFDITGMLLFSSGLVVFFLPFDLATSAPDGWASAYIVAMIIVGLALLVTFGVYEWFLAPMPMIDYNMLSNRTIIGALLMDATYQVSYYCWNNYFTSFLQVVNDLSITTAGYVNDTFDVVSGILLLLVGFLIRRTGRFKWLLYIAVPLPNQSVGYLVMCQIFISLAGAVFIIVQQLAVLAAVDHQHVATALALLNSVGTVGDALGATVSGAIWTNTFRNALARDLPSSDLSAIDDIYEDLDTQLSYSVGSAARSGIQEAYGYAQTRMLAAGTGIMALSFVWMLMIRNIDLKKVQQVKGMIF